jgi:hypothetical protein
MEAATGIEPVMRALQAPALPLGYAAADAAPSDIEECAGVCNGGNEARGDGKGSWAMLDACPDGGTGRHKGLDERVSRAATRGLDRVNSGKPTLRSCGAR